jgi:selenophosphate synthetase-related protein
MTRQHVHDIAEALRATRGFAHKRDISDVVSALGRSLPGGHGALAQAVPIGDDCAAIPDGHGGYLLFAIEGLVEDFIVRMPWFAGYCGVMVNVSDIYAMGGRPTAVVDALWSTGMNPADDVLRGLAEAAVRYGVPIVGGHSNNRSERPQLAVAILGHARRLLTSFNAKPGDLLVMAATKSRFRTGTPRRARPPRGCAPTWSCCRPSPRTGFAAPPRTSAWPARWARP